MKHLIICSILFLSTACVLQAQTEYHHGAGGHLLSAGEAGGGYGLSYEARLNLKSLGDNGALSISAYPGLGLSGFLNSRSGGSFTFSYEAPLILSYNIGKFATNDADAGAGFFVGGGYHLYAFGDDTDILKGNGIIAMLGGRFELRNTPFEINLSYTLRNKVIGARLIYLFEGRR